MTTSVPLSVGVVFRLGAVLDVALVVRIGLDARRAAGGRDQGPPDSVSLSVDWSLEVSPELSVVV